MKVRTDETVKGTDETAKKALISEASVITWEGRGDVMGDVGCHEVSENSPGLLLAVEQSKLNGVLYLNFKISSVGVGF